MTVRWIGIAAGWFPAPEGRPSVAGGASPRMRRAQIHKPRRGDRNHAVRWTEIAVAMLVVVPASLITSSAWAATGQTVVLKAAVVHIGDGRSIADGMVVIRDGRITAVGADLEVPPDSLIIQMSEGSITAGLIDANAALEPIDIMPTPPPDAGSVLGEWLRGRVRQNPPYPGTSERADSPADDRSWPGKLLGFEHLHDDSDPVCAICGGVGQLPQQGTAAGRRRGLSLVEHGSEVVPHTRVIDSVNLRSPDFARLLAGGVTTVFVAPDPGAVIGPRGAVVRTGGPLDRRIVRETGAVKATIGSEPSSLGRYNSPPRSRNVTIFSRRPNNRMGLTWVFRKAFHDTDRYARGVPVYGADTPSVEAMDVLRRVRGGEIPLRIQARMQHDIRTAIRLTEEFDLRFTLEEATEAYRCIDLLKSRSISVIFGPIYETPSWQRARTGETGNTRMHTIRTLVEAGIETALSAQELRDEDGLARQAMYAMRAGVSLQDALTLVTRAPAALLGLQDQIGTVQTGKQADLVVWSGPPFAATSQPRVVMIGGEVLLDRRGE